MAEQAGAEMKQTEAARKRASNPYWRIAQEARQDAERAYQCGALSAPDGSVLEVEVQLYRAQMHVVYLFGRCMELEDRISELDRAA